MSMIKVKRLRIGMRVWKSYENGEEQEFVVIRVWYDSTEGKFYAELIYSDDDYSKIINEDSEKDFYFK